MDWSDRSALAKSATASKPVRPPGRIGQTGSLICLSPILIVNIDKTAKDGCSVKQPRKCTIYSAVWLKGQGNGCFLRKPPRQLQIFLAAYKTRQGISLSWQLASTTKVRLYFLVVQIWPPRKLLAVKGNSVQFSCSELSSLHVISLLSNITSAS